MKLLGLEKTSLLTRKSINRSRLRSGLFLAALALAYPALSSITQAVTPHRLEAIPVKTPQRAIMPSSTSQLAPETQPLVFRRSIPTQPAAKTPPLVFLRCRITPPVKTTSHWDIRPALSLRAITIF